MTEPTDAELSELADAHTPNTETGSLNYRKFARAVLAKWGTPQAVAPWRSAVLDLIDECPGLTMEQDQWLSRRVKELDFASTPQPTQAQAGAVPMSHEEAKALVLKYGIDPLHLVLQVERHHGIKGGQHGDIVARRAAR